jgi:AI-2 transport protein TqsA
MPLSGKGIAMQAPSIFKPLILLAATAILLFAMRLAAAIVTPVLLSCFFAVLLTPVYRWLKKRLPAGLALLLSLSVMGLVAILLLLLVGNSFVALAASLQDYSAQLSQRQAELKAALGGVGQSSSGQALLSALNPDALVSVLGFVAKAAAGIFGSALLILFVTLFVLAEGPMFKLRMVQAFGADHFLPRNVTALYRSVIRYFGLRIIVNLVVAAATGLMLWLFGIPYAGLWTVMIFFLSFVPYIGAFFAMIPPVVLAYAQGGLVLALVVILLAVVINSLAENIVAPMVMGRGLSISPTVVFLSFIFWMFILGGSGAFIAMPLTVALILFMGSFAETRGLAAVMGSIPHESDEPAAAVVEGAQP